MKSPIIKSPIHFKPFSDIDFSIFECSEPQFLKYLHYLNNTNESNPFIKHDYSKALVNKIEKQANFAKTDQKEIKNIIFKEITEVKNPDFAKKLRLRSYSYTRHDFNKIFHYRYYSLMLKKMKKRVLLSYYIYICILIL